jgi:hypothetical protein
LNSFDRLDPIDPRKTIDGYRSLFQAVCGKAPVGPRRIPQDPTEHKIPALSRSFGKSRSLTTTQHSAFSVLQHIRDTAPSGKTTIP